MNPSTAAHLFHGNDEFPLTRAAQELVDALVPPAERAFGLEVVDGRVTSPGEAAMAVRRCTDGLCTAGFLTAGKLVWLRGAVFLADARLTANGEVKAALVELTESLVRGIAAGQTLLITAPGIDKRSALYRVFTTRYAVREFTLSDKAWQAERQAAETAGGLLDRAGLKADGQVVKALVERAGVDSRTLAMEIEKLNAYCGDRRMVRMEDVRSVVSASAGAVTWDLLDAVGGRNLGEAVVALRQLLAQREAAIGLLLAVNRRLNELAFYREALDRGWVTSDGSSATIRWRTLPPKVESLFTDHYDRDPRMANPYYAGKLCQQAQNFPAGELMQAQSAAAFAFEALVSGGMPEAAVVELLVLRLLRRDQG